MKKSQQNGGSTEMLPIHNFDSEKSLNWLAKMIILNDYPLHIGEESIFVAFIESLNPWFKLPDVRSMEEEIISIHHREKENLLQVFFL
jgi:hypothetical protein